MKYVVATDVGGTCTDTVIIADGKSIHIGKALSTPPDFANGVCAEAIDIAGVEKPLLLAPLARNDDLVEAVLSPGSRRIRRVNRRSKNEHQQRLCAKRLGAHTGYSHLGLVIGRPL